MEQIDKTVQMGSAVMQAIIFQCPVTGLTVQELVADEESQSREDGTRHYKGMTCAACARLHFVDPPTGDVLGETLVASNVVLTAEH